MADLSIESLIESLGPAPAAPQPRTLSGEQADILGLSGALAGSQTGSILDLSGQLTDQQLRATLAGHQALINQNLGSFYGDMWGIYGDLYSQYDVQRLNDWLWWGERDFTGTYLEENPQLAAALEQQQAAYQQQQAAYGTQQQAYDAFGRAIQTYQPVMEASAELAAPITATLNQQAYDQLLRGGKLSPEEERFAQQAAREAYTARGQVLGDTATMAEVLNRDSLARQRLQEAQAFAGSREAANQGILTTGAGLYGQQYNAAQGLGAAAQGLFGSAQGITGSMQNLAQAGTSLGQYLMTQSYGLPLAAAGYTSGLITAAQTPNYSNIATGSMAYHGQLASTSADYVSDLYNTNLNMQASMYNSYQNNLASLQAAQIQSQAAIAAANAQAAASGQAATMGAVGSIGGSVIGAGGAIAGAAIMAGAF